MMGSESNHPLLPHEEHDVDDLMQTLTLDADDDVSTSKSYSNYRSVMTTLSSSSVEHPLTAPPSIAISDPLISTRQSNPGSPSYANLILSPTESTSNGGTHDELNVSPRSQISSSGDYLKITVSNPQKEIESSSSIVPRGNNYVTYLITTNTNILDYGESDFSVRRRFKDIVTLSDRLSEGYRGFFIPPRPDKSVVEGQVMQKQDFVEQRRVDLEKYLRRLAGHPMIRKSDELRVFLTVQGRMPLPASIDVASRVLDGAVKLPKQLLGESRSLIEPQDVVQPAKGGRDLLRYFKELKQSVVNDWGSLRPSVEEEDKDFLEKKEKLWELERQLTNVSKQAESFVKAQQDMGETLGELGLTAIKLSKFENEQAFQEQALLNAQRAKAADMKVVATAAVKSSRIYRGLNAHTVNHFEALHENLSLMLAVHSAFNDRSSALLTVQTLISELASLRSRLEKLDSTSSKIFGGDKSRVRKVEELQDSIRVTEDAKSCAAREYERIKENNRVEIQRLDKERKADFVNMLKGFVSNQVTYNERIANEWDKVVEETSKYAKESI